MDDNRNILKKPWHDFALRIQNVARKKNSPAIVQMTVLVNQDGNPILWTEPKVILLEPRLTIDINSLQNKLSREELVALLDVVVRSS